MTVSLSLSEHGASWGIAPSTKAFIPGYLALDFATAASALSGTQPVPALQDVNYGAIGELAVQLTHALQELEVFELASALLFANLADVCATQFTHVLNCEVHIATFTAHGAKKQLSREPLAFGTAAAQALHLRQPVCEPDLNLGQVLWADWSQLRQDTGALCMLTTPITSKGRGTGAVTVACSKPWSLNRAARETVDIVASLVAPYMHIKDVRRDLQIAQTLLLDSLPPQVVSHMLERQTMGMTPVLSADGAVQYPRSDDEDSTDEEERSVQR
ncbi:hypothetical protein WJX72_004303 [[Myrmecia] bisecta]|uniref:GAF domain-containing protein n=1 Tax=[Myrmecia] bisecta TaxID=41462 RepID=A0AAW1Q9Z9_9CHLO